MLVLMQFIQHAALKRPGAMQHDGTAGGSKWHLVEKVGFYRHKFAVKQTGDAFFTKAGSKTAGENFIAIEMALYL